MPPLLLYDGTCGLCAWSVRFVLRRDTRGTLRFAPLQGATGREVESRHPTLTAVDSVVWVEPPTRDAPERVFTKSAAAIRVMRYLGGAWHLGRLLWVVPRPLRDAGYDLIARHRHRLHRDASQCTLPAPEQRTRFLE